MARRQHVTLTVVAAFLIFITITYLLSGGDSGASFDDREPKGKVNVAGLSDSVLHGGSIAPKLENATAK
jgi:FAD-linked sulfhydryl oxidase